MPANVEGIVGGQIFAKILPGGLVSVLTGGEYDCTRLAARTRLLLSLRSSYGEKAVDFLLFRRRETED